ncbi:hypothetical protein BCR39DRAFT_534412 [Naematelia encephala]|uniref:Histone deacetylase interacting domain-containing protein n=1 Tax=Naematelia encephala TaxID=71784 RepID=A0A1Y2B198_9TREE|nr:hypothetical protein BCR39DRAFT_534412 [Naematelia encephala]
MSAAQRANDPYRPLNVRDALSYLDQVKIQFVDQPEVYNRFLDVMKEFKGQIIDTPGVIDRVSTLFRGHPSLIQGFNTFLPPGYRIECSDEGGSQMITVTTPSGTMSQVPGGFSAALDAREREQRQRESLMGNGSGRRSPEKPAVPAEPPQTHSHLASGPPPFSSANRAGTTPRSNAAAPGPVPIPPHSQHPVSIPSGPSTPSAAHVLANGTLGAVSAGSAGRGGGTALEFNHAITFVNKIKNRFNGFPDVYKQFLEILQTYQKDNRDIADVYKQVSELFNHEPDLLDEFKAFLPENGNGGPFGSLMQASASAPPAKKTTKKEETGGKRRRPADARGSQKKKPAKADTSGEDGEGIGPVAGLPQTLVPPEDVAFFDKVKKFVDDKVVYHEFLKLLNLFSLEVVDEKTMLERAELFIGPAGDLFSSFKRMMGVDEAGNLPPNPTSAQGGYGFQGMIGVDAQVVENTPMLERVKPDMSGSKVKSYGPSYRKLPKTEINLQCTGRDAMCWEVLNDEWISHPTWAAEDAAPFLAHKKNIYEEALHKSEEERHEYDYHIEANLRTIALLEPLNNKIQTMDAADRATFNLRSSLGSQSKSIYQRVIKKVYGKELGPEVIKALHENPIVSLPIIVERLKAKDEEWKKAQREWNRVWREQDAKNFYKALDHQGVQFKTNDKKTIAAKSLIQEIEARRREHTNLRATLLNNTSWKTRPQFKFEFNDVEVLKDVVKLVISYLDRVSNALSAADKERIERQLRDFVPLLFMLDQEAFDAEFGDVEPGSGDDGSEVSEDDRSAQEDDDMSTAAKRGKRGPQPADLRKRLLKQVGERERGSTMTPAPEDGADAHSDGTPMTDDRGETPVPVPADPAEVAEAVEKDKAVAEASEQTWVQIDSPAISESSTQLSETKAKKPVRKGSFFANNQFYVLLRLIEIMYSRLLRCKRIAASLAEKKKQPINPIAIRLGLAEPETQYFGIEAGENPAQHYYGHLLAMAERLFENEVDVNTYEETLRLMFGTKAYTMFTLDRLVAAIVKQTQTIIGDIRSQELLALLQRDRAGESTTTRQQIAYRMQAEGVIGPDENLYKIEYLPSSESITIQLLGREDLTVDDAETQQEKWRQYIDSYTLTHPTEGLPHRVDEPFLKRTLREIPQDSGADMFETTSGLDVKIALGNYRMFFSPQTEDYFHRKRLPAEVVEMDLKETSLAEDATKRLEEWVQREQADEPPPNSATEVVE